jgi:predicted dehydrogenase
MAFPGQGSVSMTKPLRVGVVGLGKRWLRYRAALLDLRDDFEITALCDASFVRAEAHGRVLGCARAGGVLDLIERDDVDAVLLLDRLWWGLWPLELASRCNKPVLCCLPLTDVEPGAELLGERLRQQGPPVLMANPFAFVPVLEQFQQFVAEQLGQVSLIRAQLALPQGSKRQAGLLHRPAVFAILSVVLELLGAPLDAVWAVVDEAGRVATLVLEAGKELAEVSVWTGPHVTPACRVAVVTEKGTATATLPRRLCWQAGADQYARQMPRRSAAETALTHFAEAVRTGHPPRPGIEEAERVRNCMRAIRESRAEGRRVAVSPPNASNT